MATTATRFAAPARVRSMLAAIAAEARALGPREAVEEMVRAYRRNDLLTCASAISFRVFFALIPFLLFVLGLLGVFHLQSVWRDDVAPNLRPHVSAAAFQVIDDTVTKILGGKRLFWATAGAGLATWQISSAVRAVMGAFNRIYGARERRSFVRRMSVSLALALAVGALLLLAVAVVRAGPVAVDAVFGDGALVGAVSAVVQWAVAAGLLLVVVGLLVRFAPDAELPMRWVSFGALLVVGAWLLMSLVFGWYLTSIADYGSVFGSLATVIVVLEYLYLSSIAFLSGAQMDALLRERVRAG